MVTNLICHHQVFDSLDDTVNFNLQSGRVNNLSNTAKAAFNSQPMKYRLKGKYYYERCWIFSFHFFPPCKKTHFDLFFPYNLIQLTTFLTCKCRLHHEQGHWEQYLRDSATHLILRFQLTICVGNQCMTLLTSFVLQGQLFLYVLSIFDICVQHSKQEGAIFPLFVHKLPDHSKIRFFGRELSSRSRSFSWITVLHSTKGSGFMKEEKNVFISCCCSGKIM